MREFVMHCEDVYPAFGDGPVVFDCWLVDAERYAEFRFSDGWPSTAFSPAPDQARARKAWDAGDILLVSYWDRRLPCERLTTELLVEAGRRWAVQLGHEGPIVRLGNRHMWARGDRQAIRELDVDQLVADWERRKRGT